MYALFKNSSFLLAIAAMISVVLASNILVQYPFTPLGLADFLTYGAFTYPIAFLINDLTNRWYGARAASIIVVVGFIIAVILSILLATPRIALASGTAFLVAQMLDVFIFGKLRRTPKWWTAPLASTLIGSTLDTMIFFPIAFANGGDDFINMVQGYEILGMTFMMETWMMWAFCDYLVKLGVALTMLTAYRAVFRLHPAVAH